MRTRDLNGNVNIENDLIDNNLIKFSNIYHVFFLITLNFIIFENNPSLLKMEIFINTALKNYWQILTTILTHFYGSVL